MSDAPTVPPLVEESVAAIAELHAAHYREAGALQRPYRARLARSPGPAR